LEDEEVVERVKAVHENGGDTGSLGWRYKWSREEAERALLRTHTTVNTIRYLAKHPDPPVKVFSLSRIFRNESIDMTHLPEFMQIEGIIMEEGANFDMLVSVLKDFYGRMGFDKIRVRPGPFPYTEPSLEIEIFHNGKWMELGGAGVFRPEVTAPLGIKHPVLAWGLGFERLAMLRWDLKDIRELYITDLDMLRSSPIF
jgi:phenylalanyl-tRNA synthetase alpha chain